MGLAIRKNSKWFYARYYVDGTEFVKKLPVQIKGVPPERLSGTGDSAFEKARARAEVEFDLLVADVHSGKSTEERAQAVYQARTGTKIKRHLIDEMPQLWINKPRKRAPSASHQQQSVSKLEKLIEFLEKNFPKLNRIDQIRHHHIKAFLDDLEESRVTAETWNKYLVVIKAVLKRAGVPAAMDIVAKEVKTVFREPFTIEELHAVLEAAKSDPLIFNIAVAAATTAMRRKDCCFLRWDSVDFDEGFITVKTSKTDIEVDIPMADMLMDVVKAQRGNGSDYVFPDAKELYETNPTQVTRRFKTVLKRAGFTDGKPIVEHRTDKVSKAELQKKANEVFSGAKLKTCLAIINAYLDGQSMSQTAKTTGVVISTVSLHLNTLEQVTGKAIIRGKCRIVEDSDQPGRKVISRERKNGRLKASLRDFHSFRTTWITLALMNGMPIETVKQVTGHRTVDIVTRHYFKPHREELKIAMQKSLPGVLSNSARPFTPAERAADILRSVDAKMTKADIRKRVDDALTVLEEGTR